MLSETAVRELLDYASSYGTFSENTPNGTPCQHGGIPMNDARRAAIIAYKKVLELLPEDYRMPVTDTRPHQCRNRLRDEGKAHPKSGCEVKDCKGVFGTLCKGLQ